MFAISILSWTDAISIWKSNAQPKHMLRTWAKLLRWRRFLTHTYRHSQFEHTKNHTNIQTEFPEASNFQHTIAVASALQAHINISFIHTKANNNNSHFSKTRFLLTMIFGFHPMKFVYGLLLRACKYLLSKDFFIWRFLANMKNVQINRILCMSCAMFQTRLNFIVAWSFFLMWKEEGWKGACGLVKTRKNLRFFKSKRFGENVGE